MRNDAPINCLYSFKEKTLYEEKKKQNNKKFQKQVCATNV